MFEFDELDDLGTGFEEAAEREYERREEAAIDAVRFPDEAIIAFFAPRSCAAKTCGIYDQHTIECLPF
jgi:hypothetical protein